MPVGRRKGLERLTPHAVRDGEVPIEGAADLMDGGDRECLRCEPGGPAVLLEELELRPEPDHPIGVALAEAEAS